MYDANIGLIGHESSRIAWDLTHNISIVNSAIDCIKKSFYRYWPQTSRKKIDADLFQEIEEFLLKVLKEFRRGLPDSAKEQFQLTAMAVILKLNPDSKRRRSAVRKCFDDVNLKEVRMKLVEHEAALVDEIDGNEFFSLDEDLNRKIFSSFVDEAKELLALVESMPTSSVVNLLSDMPRQTENQKYLSRVISKVTSEMVNGSKDGEPNSDRAILFNQFVDFIFENSIVLFKMVNDILKRWLAPDYCDMDADDIVLRKQMLEMVAKSCLGIILPTLITGQHDNISCENSSGLNIKLITNLGPMS